MKKVMGIDIETYSSAPLPKCGVYRYTDSPDFEILLFSYAFDDEPVATVDLACGEQLPKEVLSALENPKIIKAAWNAQFERVCLSRHLGRWLDPHQWHCTAVMSAYLTMPARLADAAVALKLTQQKMEEGKELICYFSVPCKPTKANGGGTRNMPGNAPDKWAVYKKYNAQDVETERDARKKLEQFPVPEQEWELYALDQTINDRGVRIDKALVKSAIAVDSEFSARAYQQAQQITGLDNPGSVAQLKAWLADQDVPMESLAKKLVKEKAAETDGVVSELLNLRLELSKTSVKKYEAMARSVCRDGRVRGTLQFYGANRTGRWSGRLVQLQNVPQNHLPDLDQAREIVKRGDTETVEMLYGNVPNTLSELIRTAFIPKEGCRFIVADFSAIEARVLAWLAGEEWVLEEFRGAGKIYEETASRMYHIPKETIAKGHPNYEYRQKGKQATLSCIAEGQLVLTDHGLIPIERVTLDDRVWDGVSWVNHDGVIYRGRKETVSYEGLTATPDHFVWIEGKAEPVHFGFAASSGAHLAITEYCGKAVRLGENYQPGKAVESEVESMLCSDGMRVVSRDSMDDPGKSDTRHIERLSKLLREASSDSALVESEADCCETSLRESDRSAVSSVWRKGYPVQVSLCESSGDLDIGECNRREPGERAGSNRHQCRLCTRKHQACAQKEESGQPQNNSSFRMESSVLAILSECSDKAIVSGTDQRRNHTISTESRKRKAQELEDNKRTSRLYDIRNAGPHHRFTVSGHLVHNCGYGGGVGALKAMGAKMPEDEMQPLVDAWRTANPRIVAFWSAMERAVRSAIRKQGSARVGKVRLFWKDDKLFMRLPSGRDLCYQSPHFTENRFGGDAVGYYVPSAAGKMVEQETFGGKLVENATQAIARDLLAHAMQNLEHHGYRIVFHVHDECVMEVPLGFGSVEEACAIMGQGPAWAEGLPLRADGYECSSYRKM